jgi:hypothetical protein
MTTRSKRARRARARRLRKRVELVLRAAMGDDNVHERKRVDRSTRETVARLLGYQPDRVLGLFILLDDA